MSQSNELQKKLRWKLQSKIHRRRNEQIPKQFFCTVEECDKGYGSYAALYTHMKNKHNEIKPPTMPNTLKNRHGHPGRPKVKKRDNQKTQQIQMDNGEEQQLVCKICLQGNCECVDNFNMEENNKIVQIMSCEKFIKFINYVGLLSNEDINWVRRTEDEYIVKSNEEIAEQIKKFNALHGLQSNPSTKLIEYLSFSSRYWNTENIDELYHAIYAMIAFQNHQACIKFVTEGNYPRMQSCVKNNRNQFKKLELHVRVI